MNLGADSSICPKAPTPQLSALMEFAAAGLTQMVDPAAALFCDRMVKQGDSFKRIGISPRYSVMTLLGLHRWEGAGGRVPLDGDQYLSALLCDHGWIDNLGDTGLLLWLIGVAAPSKVEQVWNELAVETILQRFDVNRCPTMELAWFLTGLTYAAPTLPSRLRGTVGALSANVSRLLGTYQGDGGYFGHGNPHIGVRGVLRGRIGSFADQVYPIYALAHFGAAVGDDEAVRRAVRCADAICNAQGTLGQWWWHYHAGKTRVLQRYPVYSVHQDGMAPMALWAAGDASGRDYSVPIYKGLQWIYGENELGVDMRDTTSHMIWRNIHGTGVRRRVREAADVVGAPLSSTGDLGILYECRPYHLGWLLYGFAGR